MTSVEGEDDGEVDGEVEGVIKFRLDHRTGTLDRPPLAEITAWREVLVRLGMIGQTPDRYGGLGFGNLSRRTPAGFLVSGSQTGGLDEPGPEAWAEVIDFDLQNNAVQSRGEVPPSSESLTHAAIYSLDPRVNWVFHVHCPEIWNRALALGLATTGARVAYGTIEMADAVRGLFPAETTAGTFAMGGHEDGVIAFGEHADATGLSLVSLLTSALTRHSDFKFPR